MVGAAIVIAGFGGDLISHAYVEERLLPAIDLAPAGFERDVTRWWRRVARTLGPASSARAIQDVAATPLLQLLGHTHPAARAVGAGLHAELAAASSVLVCVPWTVSTASAWRDAARHGLEARAAWALVCNGRALRIVDCGRTWSTAAVEFDFERLVCSPKGVAALWALARATALAGRGADSLGGHIAASDAHASRVCRTLSDGVLTALTRLGGALSPPRRNQRDAALDQALTVVYRILFLLFAEARSLVPVWNDIYRDAYTIDALTTRAVRSAPAGLWEALQAISRLAHAGCSAGDLAVTAFNGRLFSPRHTPLAEHRHISDDVVKEVLLSLATEATRGGRRRISYHDLGVEQLGSVYERVLEYRPSRSSATFELERTSTQRKQSGSFYTPQPLTEFLVRQTLAPLVAGKSADEILTLRVVDPAMGSGAFLVTACRYLADACEHALVRDGHWQEGEERSRARATLRRAVAERCLYGVDLNPTAVQLARLSLWLTTLAADRPLTFLDHHLSAGNSLIGAWLGDLSRPPSPKTRRRPVALTLFEDAIADDLAARVLPDRIRMASEASDSLEAVRAKERALAALTRDGGPLSRWKAAADAWCAAPLSPGPQPSAGVVSEWIAAATGGATTLPAPQLAAALRNARATAADHGAFHWELEFPEVFFNAGAQPAADSGFDAVIGNPPWEMLRADLGPSTDRHQSRSTTAAALRFFRHTYRNQGTGHPNSYQLFVERALRLVRHGGRVGLLLPSGIATDHGSATLRRQLLERTAIDTWIGFDNKHRIFPIHRSVRFVLLTTTKGGETGTLRFRCGITDAASLNHAGGAQMLTLSRSRIAAMSPQLLTIPEVPNTTALRILTAIAERVPSLGDASGWQARFGRELNATDDRGHFQRLNGRDRSLLAIVEGKHVSPFQVDSARSTMGIPRRAASALLNAADTFDRARICYRDVASATNRLTLIAGMLPAGAVSTHTLFCLKTLLGDEEQWCLLGLLNSLVANYLVRLQVTTHVTTALMSRLPVPKPADGALKRIARISRRLAATGIDASVDDYATLNAHAAGLYALTRDDFAFILDSFPLIPQAHRDACLRAYARATEAQRHGGQSNQCFIKD